MVKILLTLACSMILAIAVLHLRQQRLELNYQANRLHNQIRQHQSKLWNQQLRIAEYTAPNAISQTVGQRELHMVPELPLPSNKTTWLAPRNDDAH